MLNRTHFPTDFNPVLEIILNIPPDAPSLFIETGVMFLYDFVYEFSDNENNAGGSVIDLDAIYKWIASVPEQACQILNYESFDMTEYYDHIISDLEYINNVIVFCREISEVESLGQSMADEINYFFPEKVDIFIFEGLVNFYFLFYQDTTKNTAPNDYARLSLFLMTAFTKALGNDKEINIKSDETAIIEKGIELCFEVMNRLKENEEVCEKACDVLHITIHGTGGMCLGKEKLLKFYQISSFSCFIRPYHSLFKVIDSIECDQGWFLKNCNAIFEHACNFMSHEDSNNHPLHIERLMNLLRSILERHYEQVLSSMDIGRLVTLASHGLLSQEEQTFKECHSVLVELFTRPSTSICKRRPETDSIVVRLYNSHSHLIVKDCVDVILSKRNIEYIKACGYMLSLMNVEDGYDIGTLLKFDKAHLYDILENYHNEVSIDESIFDDLTKILNVSSKEEAEDLAVSINSKLYKS
ncbi:hypothetical protein RF11_00464 [Thelohanellus kitauei]|uniref:Uncharacterized protein n=1 Tax=Thelohanellus kitauei TaxID=669202 RepID=A0A0C2INR8_THEKT|nr:hypothetical protein RF11_00464 [Thelohanellus kitauei]